MILHIDSHEISGFFSLKKQQQQQKRALRIYSLIHKLLTDPEPPTYKQIYTYVGTHTCKHTDFFFFFFFFAGGGCGGGEGGEDFE